MIEHIFCYSCLNHLKVITKSFSAARTRRRTTATVMKIFKVTGTTVLLPLLTTILINNLPTDAALNGNTLALFQMTSCSADTQHRCQIANEIESRYRFIQSSGWMLSAALCTIDVADNNTMVADLILTLFETGNMTFEVGSCIDKTVSVVFEMARNPIIFTFVSFETTRLISYLLSVDLNDNILLLAVTDQPMFPNALLERLTFVYSYETSFTLEMHQHSLMNLQTHYGISHVAFLYLKNSEEDEAMIREPCHKRSDTAYCFYMLQDWFDHRNCYKEKMVRGFDKFKETLQLLTLDPHLWAMVVYGYAPSLVRFRTYITTNHYTEFFLVPFERKIINSSIAGTGLGDYWLDKFPGQNAINGLLKFIYTYKRKIFKNRQFYKMFTSTEKVQTFAKEKSHLLKSLGFEVGSDGKLPFETWQALGRVPRFRKLIVDVVTSWNNIKEFLKYWKVSSYMSLMEPDLLLNSSFINPKYAIKAKPYCNTTIPKCPAGTELHHSEFKEANWDNSYGWHCERCPAKTYKNGTGNTECIPCLYPFTTDVNRSSCFDPFMMIHLTWNGSVEIVTLGVSSLTGCLALFTIWLFIKYKNTPIVKHTNLQMSGIQLSLHFVLSIGSILLFFSYPGRLICILRPLVIGLCLTINTAVNIGRTQKLYVIFNAKTVHSAGERRLVKRLDWLIIGAVSLVDIAFFLVFNASGDTSVLLTYHDKELVKEATCNNNMDVIIQLLFLLSLILVNGFNAFRARHLPSYFKETTHVSYSSFTSIVSLSGLLAIYFTQRKILAKEMVLLVFVNTVNLMNFLLIYSYKVFVIVFRPQQNTVAAFNIMRYAKMQKQFHCN